MKEFIHKKIPVKYYGFVDLDKPPFKQLTPREHLEKELANEKADSPVIKALMDITLLMYHPVNTREHTKTHWRMERRIHSKKTGWIYDYARAKRCNYLSPYYTESYAYGKKEDYEKIIFDLNEINQSKKDKKKKV
jgi:hypothetical protein